MKTQISIILYCLVATTFLHAQNKEQELATYFSALATNQQFSGNVLIEEKGKILYQHSFGYSDFASSTPNTNKTVFPFASISKTFTTTAILQLVQTNRLNLRDPVTKYLPGFPYATITLTHLLSHTSGLPPYNAFFDSTWHANPGRVFTNNDFLDGINRHFQPLLYQPGEKGNYDNINFIVLALVVEKVSGTSYTEYVNKNILIPASMKHTRFMPLKTQYEQTGNKNFAFPHLYPHLYSDSLVRANTVPYIISYWSAYNFSGFGDYAGTTEDLLRFGEAYDNRRLLDKTIMQEAFTIVKLNDGNNNPGTFGLGWEIEADTTLGKIVYHSGGATGLSCILLKNISKDQTIILFDNTHSNAHEVASNALKILNGIAVPQPKKSLAWLFGKALVKEGSKEALNTVSRLKEDTLNYYLSEDEFNLLGYDFMGGRNNPNPYHFPEEHKYAEALETFKLNTQLFPKSWNVYDSYGEILSTLGRKPEAIEMYRKSVELNPANESGIKALKQLLE
ncbi:MAG TPA: serine hydrolase domain-containing protein [Flavitalea sp.]|nr:serine hydrolase domain-containing protein [Flavitalea sp.]